MESVDIQNWEVVKPYDRNGCKVRIYQGTDDDGIIVYRYEVEEPSGYIQDPAEPFPFDTQEACESGADEDADHYENEDPDHYENEDAD